MVYLGLLYLATVILFTGNIPDSDNIAAREESVIVIGAGVSGLAAARRLRQHGFRNITILEANDRIGGRANTIVWDEGRFIELGAQFVHGEEDNAVYAIAAEKGLMHYVPPGQQGHEDEIIIRTDQGTLVDNKLGTTIMSTVEEALKKAYAVDDARYATVQDYLNSKLLEFHTGNPTLNKQMTESLWRSVEATMRIDHGCDSFKQMSLASTFEFRRSSGNYLGRLKRGYISIVESLANDIPKESIRLLQKVTRIDTNSKKGVRVVTEDGIVYHADHVIVTVSLGVLKAKAQDLFIPRLPQRKLEAFQAVGFGTVNKVFLQFESSFWEDGWKYLGLVWTGDTNTNSQLPWEHGISLFEVVSTTRNTLMGWLTGEAARQMESKTDREIISTCVKVLKQFTGRQSLPKVVAMKRSRWFSDENFKGSYSFRTVESNLISGLNDTLSEPLYGGTSTGVQNSPIVLFAGEHTHPYYYSTVHGALESGQREATRIIEYYKDFTQQVKSAP